MQYIKMFLFSVAFAMIVNACNQSAMSQNGTSGLYDTEAFKEYWYAGKAEISAYNLVQSRYGESRPGKAMLIFVTEGFSKSKHVKLDDPESAGDDKVTVMKLNYTKNFVTGIYPYSMMLSSFTPVSRNQFPNTLKVTMSSQEWCGHVFTQMNLNEKKYDVASYSYFEKEGDALFKINKVLLEDELFNLIRIDPENIPLGDINILPGLFFTRMKHENLHPVSANLERTTHEGSTTYTLKVPNRTLAVHVDNNFPHKILGWEEEIQDGDNILNSKATLDKTIITDYWRKHKNEDLHLRDSLGLSPTNY